MNSNYKRRKLMVIILSIIMFLLGICIFLYPTVSNYLAKVQYKRLIVSYERTNKEIKEDDKIYEYEEALKYNQSLTGESVHDPFIAGSGYVLPDNYNEVLNINKNGIMGYIEIPKISLRIPIYHGSSTDVLQKGIGHLESSALPIGGIGNNPVLTGHRGLPRAELFTRLDELKKNDLVYIYVLNDILAYKVSDIMEIEPGDISKLGAYKDRDMITLITCTPYGINTHRLVIQADRTEYIPEVKDNIKPSHSFKLSEASIIRFSGVIIGLIFLYAAINILKRKGFNKGLLITKDKKEDKKKRGKSHDKKKNK